MINNTKLDHVLDVDPAATTAALVPAEPEVLPAPTTPPSLPTFTTAPIDPHNAKLDDDVEFARESIKDLIDSGRSAVQGALEIAQSSDQPRAYEVVATVISSVVQANEALVGLHKTKKDATKDAPTVGGEGGGQTINIDKAVFFGRAQDLLRETLKARDALKTVTVEKNDDASDA